MTHYVALFLLAFFALSIFFIILALGFKGLFECHKKPISIRKKPEIGAYYRLKDDPWGDRLVIVIDVKDGHVKYNLYSRELGVIGKSTMKISSFFYVYKKNEDQNIKIESQS